VQRPLVRRFDVHVGRCRTCHRRVQGRHPLQTSDALGAAAVQLGPQAVALAVVLNKDLGLPYAKIARLWRERFGLTITASGLVHAVRRAARQAQPAYDALCATVRGSPVVTPDETMSPHGLVVAPGHYLERLGRLLTRTPSRRLRVRRFQQHLMVEFAAIFSFLFDPTLDATNWRAEHALRPAVVTRKMCGGGHRTARGAQTQQVLASVLRTAAQRGLDRTHLLAQLLHARTPTVPISLRTPLAAH
jgi:hypothetical protein